MAAAMKNTVLLARDPWERDIGHLLGGIEKPHYNELA
jgi:hypothetical protein